MKRNKRQSTEPINDRPTQVKLEIHVLWSVPTSRSNTDREGAPKTIVYGGYRRLRISSQAIKRAVRQYTHEYGLLERSHWAVRTKLLPAKLSERLVAAGLEVTHANELVEKTLMTIGLAVKDEGKTEYPLFFETALLDQLIEVMLEHQTEIASLALDSSERTSKAERKKVASAELQALLTAPFLTIPKIERALFGRNLADLPEASTYGCVQMMHPLSVHETHDETDFFSVTDDYLSATHRGSAHIGTTGIAAPTFYGFAALNLTELAERLQNVEAAQLGARAFIEAMIKSWPSGAARSTAAATLPSYVLLQRVVNAITFNGAPAFELPLRPRGRASLSALAQEVLERHLDETLTRYNETQGRRRVRLIAKDPIVQLSPEFAETAPDLATAIERILEA
jgi:CRISPR system Cascade subunit CasC